MSDDDGMDDALRSGLTLLIVDGHAKVRLALAERLGRMGEVRAVVGAGDLATGVRIANALAPDVVLFDPRTIAGDGATALALLGAGQRPVVVYASSLDTDELGQFTRAGAAAVLLKRLESHALLALLMRLPRAPQDRAQRAHIETGVTPRLATSS